MDLRPFDAHACGAWIVTGRLGLLMLLLVAGCNRQTGTQTDVVFHVAPTTRPNADRLRITFFGPDADESPRTEPVVRADPAAGGLTGSLIARFPVRPRGGDARRTFEVRGELLEDGEPVLTVRAGGGFVDGEHRAIHVWFHPECEGLTDCGAGRTCDRGTCVGACFESVDAASEPNLEPPLCAECQRCEANRCVDLPDTSPCGCGGQACSRGACVQTPAVDTVRLGFGHGCAIVGRSPYCWGDAHAERIAAPSERPVEVMGVEGAMRVATEEAGTCVVGIADGEVPFRTCWGFNPGGRLGLGDTTSDVLPPTNAPTSDPDWIDIAAGNAIYCGIDRTRRLYCWGGGEFGIGDGPGMPWSSVTLMTEETGWRALDVEWLHGCAVHQDGRVMCFGYNDQLQLGLADPLAIGPHIVESRGTPMEGVTDLDVAKTRSCVVRSGQLWCWGTESAGPQAEPERIDERDGWTAVAVGLRFVCGLRDEGELHCRGGNERGQLGLGDVNDRDSFERVSRTRDQRFRTVFARDESACAIDLGGALWCWGDNLANTFDVDGGDAKVPGLLGVGADAGEFVTRPERVCFPL
ncbi:MAG: RCC1 domain-containing protein [Sandaracinaceae bacterium]